MQLQYFFEYYPDKWLWLQVNRKWTTKYNAQCNHKSTVWISFYEINEIQSTTCFRKNINLEVWNILQLWSRISIIMHKLVLKKLLSQKNIPNAQIVNNVVWRFRLKLCILRAFLLLLQLIMLVLRRWISYGNYKQRKEMPTHSMKCYLEPYY